MVKPSRPTRIQGFDVALINYLRMSWTYGKTGRLEVENKSAKARANLYFMEGTLCRLDIQYESASPEPEPIEETLLNVLRWVKPELQWYDNEECEDPVLRIEAGEILSLTEDKSLQRRAARWSRITCQLYKKKLVPILPLDLLLITPDGKTAHNRMEANEVVVGRAPDADIMVESQSLSRYHAHICCGKQGLFLWDTGSRNGTFLNGTRLTPYANVPFSMHDKLMLADVRLEVRHAANMTVAAYKLIAEEHMNRLNRTAQRLPAGKLFGKSGASLDMTSAMPKVIEGDGK
ncbi:MAG: FHA domain-containing protein [Methylacidiphilales bacterium]|nr:FHA domain-containing protein [Candidatus Methylacidiphilales bacterium]